MSDYHFETQAIRIQTERSQFSEHSTPMYVTSSFVFAWVVTNFKLVMVILSSKESLDDKFEYFENAQNLNYGIFRFREIGPLTEDAHPLPPHSPKSGS